MSKSQIPIIDIEPLLNNHVDKTTVVEGINIACRESGFFYIVGHGLSKELQKELERLSWKFFSQFEPVKLEIIMSKGGKAWRGYFPVEAELTSGRPDLKEGLYFGEELAPEHSLVKLGTPLHGQNLYPDIPGIEEVVLEYMKALTKLGRLLMQGIALSLKLPADYFESKFMVNPLTLFRIFHYPAQTKKSLAGGQWGAGEHTDYGVLTILKQDTAGGLQVFTKENWVEAPYIEDSFICNIGDMLDLMTGGYYRSTPHRVLNTSGRGRLSFPFFFDLDFNATPEVIDLGHLGHNSTNNYQRWDKSNLQVFKGTYGTYLLKKVAKVFPQLGDGML